MNVVNKTVTIPDSVFDIIKILNNAGYNAYLVGGCVRDLYLDKEPHDWDMCTSATPEQIKEVLKNNNITFHTVGEKFGTITALCNGEYEITTYRSETTYSDNRHPDKIEFETDIHKDLMRRDFTINAMAYNPITKELIDDWKGLDDLNHKIIRCVGDADTRFKEDSLRILRAIRFAIRYNFDIDDNTSHFIHQNKELLKNVSKERITKELRTILTNGNPIKDKFLSYKDVIRIIIPEMEPCFDFKQNNKWHKHDVYEHILSVVDGCDTDKFEVKLAALLHDIGKPDSYTVDEEGWGHFYGHPDISHEISKNVINKRLSLTVNERTMVQDLVLYHDMEIPQTVKSVKRLLNKFDETFINNWMVLKQADINDHVYDHVPEEKRDKIHFLNKEFVIETIQKIKEKEECFSIKDLAINGNDLIQIYGMKPGKEIGFILNQLVEDIIDEKVSNTKEGLLNRINIIIAENNIQCNISLINTDSRVKTIENALEKSINLKEIDSKNISR